MINLITKLLAFAWLLPVIAFANDDISDTLRTYALPSVTVTSVRANEQTPIPYVELSKAVIQQTYTTQDIPSLLVGLPSIVFYSENGNSIGYSNLTMRGFDQRRISVMINGIPQNDPEDHNVYWIDFPDLASNLEEIQIQRGAGLINYGSAAIGGSINLTTTNYANSKGLFIASGIGFQQYANDIKLNVNKQSIEFSSGLQNNYAYYGRLSRIFSNGYRDRSFADLNSYFFSASRFDEKVTSQINIFGGPLHDGLAYTGLPKSWTADYSMRRKNPAWWSYDSTGTNIDYFEHRRPQETEKFSQPHFELLNEITLTDNAKILSSLFYYEGNGYFDYDASWADTNMLRINFEQGFNPQQNPVSTIFRGAVENKQGGWIPRFVFNHTNGELLIGSELRMHRALHYGKIVSANNLPDDFNPAFRTYEYRGIRDILSFFLRENYKLSNILTITGEFQINYQRYSIDNEKFGNIYSRYLNIDGSVINNGENLFDIKYLFFNPRLAFNLIPNQNTRIYGFAALTSREPRMRNIYAADDSYFGAAPLFNAVINPDGQIAFDFQKPLTKPEQMLNLEFGYVFSNDFLYFNANLYWMEYMNELVKSGKIDVFGNPIDGNAEKTRHYGIELFGKYLLKTNFGLISFSANSTISRNKIIAYNWILSDNEDPNLSAISLSGNSIAGFPDLMFNFSLDYYFNNLSLKIAYHYVGSSKTDNFGNLLTESTLLKEHLGFDYYTDNTLEAYSFLNTNISYKIENILTLQHLKLHLQINNLLNQIYNAGATGKYFFPAAERNLYFGIELGL